jgi:hypothetical protein
MRRQVYGAFWQLEPAGEHELGFGGEFLAVECDHETRLFYQVG